VSKVHREQIVFSAEVKFYIPFCIYFVVCKIFGDAFICLKDNCSFALCAYFLESISERFLYHF